MRRSNNRYSRPAGEDDAIKPVQLIDRVGSFEPGAMMDAGRWDAVQLRDDLTRDSPDAFIDLLHEQPQLWRVRCCTKPDGHWHHGLH